MRLILAAMLSFGLSGCWLSDTSKSFTEKELGIASGVVNITEDTTLSKDYEGVQFVVSNGATLYAGDHVLSGLTSDGKSLGSVVTLADGNLNGGDIRFSRGGVVLRPVGLPSDWQQVLHDLPQEDRIAYLNQLRNGLTEHCQRIEGTKFYHNRNHIYITALNKCAVIDGITIERGRLGIYHDFGSQNAIVTNSVFDSVGRDYYSNKLTGGWVEYPSARESVAVDGSSYNQYLGNTFQNGASDAMRLYVNCGEEDPNGLAVPREEPAQGNIIQQNIFDSFDRGIWVSSRAIDRKTYPCRADDQGDRVIDTKPLPLENNNTFINVDEKVKHGGE